MAWIDDLKSVSEWARLDGVPYFTVIKRRQVAGLGVRIPPGTWLLTRKEWDKVRRTPLPGCVNGPK